MNDKRITAKASIAIQKSIKEVFQAIVNPEIMCQYFIAQSSGKMETGAELVWKFPEFGDKIAVSVQQVIPNQQVSFLWDPKSMVEITLTSLSENNTKVLVRETGYQSDDNGITWVIDQTEGWSNFLACMKAWLEYQVPLRKGAFDFSPS